MNKAQACPSTQICIQWNRPPLSQNPAPSAGKVSGAASSDTLRTIWPVPDFSPSDLESASTLMLSSIPTTELGQTLEVMSFLDDPKVKKFVTDDRTKDIPLGDVLKHAQYDDETRKSAYAKRYEDRYGEPVWETPAESARKCEGILAVHNMFPEHWVFELSEQQASIKIRTLMNQYWFSKKRAIDALDFGWCARRPRRRLSKIERLDYNAFSALAASYYLFWPYIESAVSKIFPVTSIMPESVFHFNRATLIVWATLFARKWSNMQASVAEKDQVIWELRWAFPSNLVLWAWMMGVVSALINLPHVYITSQHFAQLSLFTSTLITLMPSYYSRKSSRSWVKTAQRDFDSFDD